MDSRRLLRIVLRRWWLIAIVAVAAASAGYLFTQRQNDAIEDTFEATAPVLILKTNSESDDAYETRLRSVESGARLALATEISGPTRLSIESSVGLRRLEFQARAGTEQEAVALAEGLRNAYEEAEPGADTIGQLREELSRLEVEISSLRAERARMTAGTPVDPSVAADLVLMEAKLSSLYQQASALKLGVRVPQLATAPDEFGNPRPVEDVEAELANLNLDILRLENEYEALRGSNLTVEAPTEENLDLLVLDQKIRDAESLYVSNSLTIEELLGGTSTNLFNTETTVANVTELPASPRRAGALGLLLGVAASLAALIGADRLRRPILGFEDDMALTLLGHVDPNRPGAIEDRAWYPGADDIRRSDIQALRASLESVTSRGTVTIGLSGVGASDSAVQELAADIATSIAAADRKVLLVDAVLGSPSGLPEYGTTGTTLADIVSRRPAADDAWAELKELLGERDEVVPELLALRAGDLKGDPVDAVAGRRFRELLEVAREFVEVVIVAAPAWGDTATDVLTQRLEHFVLVGRIGVTPATDVEEAAAEMASRNATALGLVLLRRRRRLQGQVLERRSRRARERDPAVAPATDYAPAAPVQAPTVGVPRSEVLEPGTWYDDSEPAHHGAGDREPAAGPERAVSAVTRDEAVTPGEARTPDEPLRPEIVTPTPKSATLGSTEHIHEIHLADDGDVIDVAAAGTADEHVATPAPASPLDEAVRHHEPAAGSTPDENDALESAHDDQVETATTHNGDGTGSSLRDRVQKARGITSAPPPPEGITNAPSPWPSSDREPAPPRSDTLTPQDEAAATGREDTRRRRSSLTSWTRWGRHGRRSHDDSTSDRKGRARWVAPLESGEIYLIEQLSELLRHGIDKPRLYGHPSGALLMYPNRLTESAAAMLYNAVFKDAPARSEDLEDSIARVLSIEPTQRKQQAVVENIDWWFQTLGIESDNTKRELLVEALDTWLRQRLMGALEDLRINDFAWYIASPAGTFEAIIDAQSFDAARVLSLRAGAVGRYLERLRISLWREAEAEPHEIEVVREALADIEAFDAALQQLSETHQDRPFARDQLADAGVLRRDIYSGS